MMQLRTIPLMSGNKNSSAKALLFFIYERTLTVQTDLHPFTTKPAQAQGSRLPAMRHRSLNNFHKKWDNTTDLHPWAPP